MATAKVVGKDNIGNDRFAIITEIKVTLGAVIPTQQYANFRPEVSVNIALPEKATAEEIEAAFAMGWERVGKEIGQALEDIKGSK